MNNPLISVIMAVYNEPTDWMEEAIDSILNQTFTDFEFLIIDDNPKRVENKEIIKQYITKDKRIRLIENAENMGLTKSLNKGLDMSKGKYIARMDADDISLPDRFSKQIDFLQNNPEYILCGSWVQYFGVKNKVRRYEVTDEKIRMDMIYDCPIAHPSVVMLGDVLRKQGLKYDESFRTSQDYAMWFELSKYGKLYNLPEVLVKYRMSDNRVTLTKRNEQLKNAALIRKKVLGYWMSGLNISFDPDESELTGGQSLAEFRKLRKRLLNKKKYSPAYLNKLSATITMVLYASISEYRLKYLLSLISVDARAFLYEPKKFVKALLYLLKVRPAKETLV